MNNISAYDLLPENFEQIKKKVPNLKISNHLSSGNPLKNFLIKAENKQSSRLFFKITCLAILAYLSFFAGMALHQKHPDAVTILILLLPVYAVAFFSWKHSLLTPYCLAQILSAFRIYPIINDSLKKAENNSQKKITSIKKIKKTLFNKFFILAHIGTLQKIPNEEETKLLSVRNFVDQIYISRFIGIFGLAIIFICFYQSVFYLTIPVIDTPNVLNDFISDITFATPFFSANAFLNFLILTIISINFILYFRDIFEPYQKKQLLKFIKNKPDGNIKKYIFRPLTQILYFLIIIHLLIFLSVGVKTLYTEPYSTAKWLPTLTTFALFAIIFYLLSVFCAFIIRKTALFLDIFCRS